MLSSTSGHHEWSSSILHTPSLSQQIIRKNFYITNATLHRLNTWEHSCQRMLAGMYVPRHAGMQKCWRACSHAFLFEKNENIQSYQNACQHLYFQYSFTQSELYILNKTIKVKLCLHIAPSTRDNRSSNVSRFIRV